MKKPFVATVRVQQNSEASAYFFAFRGNQLLIRMENEQVDIPQLSSTMMLDMRFLRKQNIGYYDGVPCFSLELHLDTEAPPGMTFQTLRELFFRVDEDLLQIAGRAYQIVNWDRDHQFCGRCGSRMVTSEKDHSKACPNCKLVNFPRIAPAVIMSITRGDEILLARSPRFLPGRYSVLAGFVEPGETLEETVARETFEETGVHIKNIQYFGSQPWPFPNSLMIGFTAEYDYGDIVVDGEEIEDAGWYTRDTLPGLPSAYSISRSLIDNFLSRREHS
ncbi:MAG: NAD(+) diphosphatase [Calditrichia bacterium]